MEYVLFYLVILIANIIQGITGFAGTILAMPFSLKLVGMDVAVPVLNLLGLFSGIYVLAGNYRHVDRKELIRVVTVMECAVLVGLWARNMLSGKPQLLYYILGIVVLAMAVDGLVKLFKRPVTADSEDHRGSLAGPAGDLAMLAAAGLIHGMFVCGGPLLIGYLAKKLPDKAAFRATISTVWIFLNCTIFISQLISGSWSLQLMRTQLISLPFLCAGMFIGSILYRKMDQRQFMIITYVLLFIAGLTLLFK